MNGSSDHSTVCNILYVKGQSRKPISINLFEENKRTKSKIKCPNLYIQIYHLFPQKPLQTQ